MIRAEAPRVRPIERGAQRPPGRERARETGRRTRPVIGVVPRETVASRPRPTAGDGGFLRYITRYRERPWPLVPGRPPGTGGFFVT